jgi:hypothetical protein
MKFPYLDTRSVLGLLSAMESHYLSEFCLITLSMDSLQSSKVLEVSEFNSLCFSILWLLMKMQLVHNHSFLNRFWAQSNTDLDTLLIRMIVMWLPRFCVPVFRIFCNFACFLYSRGQMPIRTVLPRFYATLGGPDRSVKSVFYCILYVELCRITDM